MALPTAGSAISLNQVNVELALTGTTAIQMNQTNVRTLFAKPSGAISMSDGHGKSAGAAAITSVVISGPTTYSGGTYVAGTAPAWTVLITYSNSTTSTDCTLLTWGQYTGKFNTGTTVVVGLKTLVVTAAKVTLSSLGNIGGGTGYIKAVAGNGIAGYINVTWSCLPLNTLITMADNTQRAMRDIKVGDTVKAIDPTTHEISNEQVTFVLDTNISYDLIRITCANNSIVEPTPEHEVWIRRNGVTMWVESKDVLVDDELLSADLSYTGVTSVGPIHCDDGVQVGNISVANAKVYFAERLLMHNTG
jgi:hypothetical protein